ncbi:hypothetical protein TUM4438_18310 [Shewanella sairae]|uniref:Flp pilus-assembly TadG-like N-terminal domain-containing protein n=2 Tax=Shewanella sairae TaxID=190310 RepID=A0ABQ4PCG3_9GAMM|nr:hypothetical protein TUM4438_18310 [Shewanella sairae]
MLKQQGQAMVLSLILMSFALMVVIFSFNASQLNLNSTRLQNTADNTAYSIATIAARDFNFKAYTNRASVANQVAVAQMVGLSSWFNMTETFAQNACNYLCGWPYIGPVVSGINQAVAGINQFAQPVFEVLINLENITLITLRASQQIIHFAGAFSTISTAPEIVRANDPDAQFDWLQNAQMFNSVSGLWLNFQEQHARNNQNQGRTQYQDFIGVVLNSRDDFSKRRTYSLESPWTKDFDLVKWETIKAGGSDLISNGQNEPETWTAMDTLSFHGWTRYGCGTFGHRSCNWEWPLGWASTRSDSRAEISSSGNSNSWGSSRSKNRSASYYAGYEQETRGSFSGIQPFYGLSNQSLSINSTDNIAVVVSKSQQRIRTSSSVAVGEANTNPAKNENMLGDRMSALSTAQVYYSRPNDLMQSTLAWSRNDSRHEYGNLYNPFWQTRLSKSSNNERQAVLTLTRYL